MVEPRQEPVLAVSHLRAYYRTRSFGVEREVRAVDDVSLEVGADEIYGLAGESSCGKTTLIKTIAGASGAAPWWHSPGWEWRSRRIVS
jgi:peptide/nickel transport system ATP-binding protein